MESLAYPKATLQHQDFGKTISGFRILKHHCPLAHSFLFVPPYFPAFGNPGSETAKPWISVAVTHFRPVFTMAGLTPKDPVV